MTYCVVVAEVYQGFNHVELISNLKGVNLYYRLLHNYRQLDNSTTPS